MLIGVEGIWSGRIIYSAQNARALIADVSYIRSGPARGAKLMATELQKEADSDV